jgi:hypothetical protein
MQQWYKEYLADFKDNCSTLSVGEKNCFVVTHLRSHEHGTSSMERSNQMPSETLHGILFSTL